LLGGLIAAAEQNNDFLSCVLVINPVARAIMNTQFGNVIAYGAGITGVAGSKAINPFIDKGFTRMVSQFFNPY
jgi:hypothetical protein